MYCYYLDSSVLDVRTIAEVTKRCKLQLRPANPQMELLLLTCQRIELFTSSPEEPAFLRNQFGYAPQRLMGVRSIFRRLVEIACGMRSQLLGERFIFEQVRRSFNSVPVDGQFWLLLKCALSTAEELRNTYRFFALRDYQEIVFNLLSAGSCDGPRPSSLVVIGGGMLGRAIATAGRARGYERVALLTRDPRKARKHQPPQTDVCSLSTMPEQITREPFLCFLATDNLDGKYKQDVLELLYSPNSLRTVDLSSVPVFDESSFDGKPYTTMYGEHYLSEVRKNNERLMPLVPRLYEHIELLSKSALFQEMTNFFLLNGAGSHYSLPQTELCRVGQPK